METIIIEFISVFLQIYFMFFFSILFSEPIGQS